MSNEIFAHTATTEQVVYFRWKLDNFLSERLWQTVSTVNGPDITIPTQPPTVWSTFIDKKQMSSLEGLYYIFRCQPLNELKLEKESQIELELSFQDIKGNPICRTVENEVRVVFATYSRSFTDKKYKNIVVLLVNNNLILNCCFKVISCSTSCHVSSEVCPVNDLHCLLEDLRTLCSLKSHSDFTIAVNDKTFSVHKCILSSRSPVFAAMFKFHTLESRNNKLVIKDFDTKTVKLFILYIYTGQLDELSVEDYFHLYSISDKYEVVCLNRTCAQKLAKCISVENVCDIYALGYYHIDTVLKSAAKTYINENTSSVLLSESWRKIAVQNKGVAAEIVREFRML